MPRLDSMEYEFVVCNYAAKYGRRMRLRIEDLVPFVDTDEPQLQCN